MQFGRKSEKLDHQIEQLELQLEDLQADDAEAEREMPPADRAPRQRAPRKPLPEHLARDEKVYLPATTDYPACGGNLKQLGEDVSEQLEFVPASFRVIRHVRPKLACGCCDAIVQAPAPRAGRSNVASPALAYWPMCWSPSSPTTCRCTASPSFMHAKALIWTGHCLPAGWARPARCCAHWSTPSVSMCWQHKNCTPTTPRYRCSHRATEKRKLDACGPMCGTTGRRVT
jgi:hypothetical protein